MSVIGVPSHRGTPISSFPRRRGRESRPLSAHAWPTLLTKLSVDSCLRRKDEGVAGEGGEVDAKGIIKVSKAPAPGGIFLEETPMPGKTPFRFLVLAALFTLLIPLAVNTPGAAADGDEDQFTIPEKAELKYPNLGSMLNQMAARVEAGQATAEDAAADAPVHRAESVAVTIYLSGNVDEAVQFLEDFGGDPRNAGEDYIEAYVPVSLLGPLSEQPGVIRVREIIPPQPAYGDFTSQGVQVHLSEAWNQAGYSGQGIKVGVIDLGFEGFRDLMGVELPANVQARCYTDLGRFTRNLADCENGDDHGTGVAETIIDVAPQVSLYIANPKIQWRLAGHCRVDGFRKEYRWSVAQ